jgi:2-oxoglutarate dehydrogenase E2 component (dihydrolipoamide succinyltransferase)
MTANIVVPEMGESVVEATIARWMKQEGDTIKAGEPVVELETDKVNVEVPAEADGILSRIMHPEGADVKIGDVLAVLDEAGTGKPTDGAAAQAAAPAPEAPPPVTPVEPPAQDGDEEGERVTPVAKRLAAEHGVDLAAVTPSQPGGRVTKQDVESYLQAQQPEPPAPAPASRVSTPTPAPAPTAQPSVSAADARGERRQRMSRRRRTIAERLVQAQQTAAMLTTFNEIDMSAVMELRKRRNEGFEKRHGIKVGFMSFFIKATIGALKAFPALNAEIQGDEIVYKQFYDIGIAVGADEGLVVPVLRDADRMTFAAIEEAVKELATKARDGALSIEDLRGGTFTLTNGGVFGSLLSTPILNPPQVGILGMHKIEDRPIALGGQVVIRPMMYVALSYDHRIVDGREAVQFLVKVKELVEDPETLLLEG